ncbi:hypothetical protein CORC01_11901 [Colletotrichum orchidophilum]|uniref:T6SS Phospholipase effector Tle1-like catalytic domain-containing protein n=1 Tax=Colletotrichum orchidophilum TaxID=1209926 RepID=A0A1G4AUR7_9PEZI|nr:uncharacterized protein CORC01_11901 [Colletotrichum orchidophilum]OHE92823.1 hypothetical protein CORC01_11901 [Colletotrichum orchidophilum]
MAPVETDSSNESRKLVLCFDGTGNSFTGSGSDTNVVKLLRMLDRNDKHQYHYYQTGIGTYDVDDTSVNKGWAGEMRSNISQKIDMGFGTTFDAHVIAGYRFLMRYYETGDRIYIFGFSRGAFTARFLARMVNTVGLLCKGNEEMVPFAYKLYQNHLANVKKSEKNSEGGATNTSDVPVAQVTKANTNGTYGTMETPVSPPDTPINEAFPNAVTSPGDVSPKSTGRKVRRGKRNEIEAFSKTFCRKEESDHGKDNIKVFFLGMWDCVNSVKVLEQAGDKPASVKGTATFVRHAVAVDEFRVKFKPALLAQDVTKPSKKRHNHVEDIKEVWFPGNHGDVGGGWSAIKDDPTWKAKEAQRIKAQRLEGEEAGADEHTYPLDNPTIWGRFLRLIGLGEEEEEIDDTEEMQLSDIPLSWMIRELELADQEYEKKTGKTGLKWRPRRLNRFKESIYQNEEKQTQALKGWIHDLLRFGNGMGYFKPFMWYLLEFCPLIKRWELDDKNGGWALTTFPLNGGGPRDIPRNAILHESLHRRLHNDDDYQPQNNHGNLKEACLRKNREHYDPHTTHEGDCAESCFHNTWKFKAHGTGADHVESLATS